MSYQQKCIIISGFIVLGYEQRLAKYLYKYSKQNLVTILLYCVIEVDALSGMKQIPDLTFVSRALLLHNSYTNRNVNHLLSNKFVISNLVPLTTICSSAVLRVTN